MQFDPMINYYLNLAEKRMKRLHPSKNGRLSPEAYKIISCLDEIRCYLSTHKLRICPKCKLEDNTCWQTCNRCGFKFDEACAKCGSTDGQCGC